MYLFLFMIFRISSHPSLDAGWLVGLLLVIVAPVKPTGNFFTCRSGLKIILKFWTETSNPDVFKGGMMWMQQEKNEVKSGGM